LTELLAALVTVAGFVGSLGYLFGSPLLYGGDIIPLSCSTTVTFLLLGSALLAAAGPKSLLMGAIVGPSVRARLLRAFLPIVAGLVLLQAAMNYLMPDFFHSYPGLSSALLAIGFLLITGAVVTLIGRVIGQDIDRSEEALFRAKEELERTFDAIPDFIAVLDTQYRIIKVNKSMRARLGLKPKESIDLKCYEYIHNTISPPDFCPHRQLLTDGRQHTVEIHEENLGGDFIVTVSPLHDSKGKIIGSVHVAHDITERKQAEAEIKRLASFPQLDPSPIMEIDTTGTVTFYNQGALDTLEQLGLTAGVEALFPEDLGEILAAVRDKKERHFYREVQIKDAVFAEDISYIEPLEVIRIYARDITQRKVAEIVRDQLINQLQEAMSQIKTLRGFLPICAYCKKIRDDEGYWQQIEKYIKDHSDAEFSHGICPDCLKEHFPHFIEEDL
jgi:PAS domain S-box-containing protein